MVNNKRGLVEKGQHKVQKMCLVSEKPSDLPSSFEMPVFIGVSTREVFRQDLPYTSLGPPLLRQHESYSITAWPGPIDNNKTITIFQPSSADGFCCPHFFDEMFGRLKNILYLCTHKLIV